MNGIETIAVDRPLAQRAAAVRERTNLKLPDAYVLATAIHADKRGWEEVRLATFDVVLAAADAQLRPA